MKNKLMEIIRYYGIRHQLKKLNEEVFELTEAIILHLELVVNRENEAMTRGFRIEKKVREENIIEELADVYVLTEQIRLKYGITPEVLRNSMEQKINRQIKRIENGE